MTEAARRKPPVVQSPLRRNFALIYAAACFRKLLLCVTQP